MEIKNAVDAEKAKADKAIRQIKAESNSILIKLNGEVVARRASKREAAEREAEMQRRFDQLKR